MSNVVITANRLGKQYRIGERLQYKALRDTLADAIHAPFRMVRSLLDESDHETASEETIWALQDVSFEVKQGEVLGIIGRNGAGKSTLLKILSRITEPTTGFVDLCGRVGSLLEVGTGFHPELTGRENMYLNGSIIGMKKREVDSQFDEIVAFAEIEQFLDTPVKYYSSGMYMRLAFAVAAHLEPEILIVDEVLSVGDAAFQSKCLGKMDDVAKHGRTVLFVSHNLAAVRHLCQTAILLSEGRIELTGSVRDVTSHYESTILANSIKHRSPGVLFSRADDVTQESPTITCVEVLDEQEERKSTISTWDYVCFRIHYASSTTVSRASAEISVATLADVPVLRCSTQPDSNISLDIVAGENYIDCIFPQWPLAAGRYVVDVALALPMKAYLCRLTEPEIIEVQPRDVFDSGKIMPESSRALLAVPHQWKIGS